MANLPLISTSNTQFSGTHCTNSIEIVCFACDGRQNVSVIPHQSYVDVTCSRCTAVNRAQIESVEVPTTFPAVQHPPSVAPKTLEIVCYACTMAQNIDIPPNKDYVDVSCTTCTTVNRAEIPLRSRYINSTASISPSVSRTSDVSRKPVQRALLIGVRYQGTSAQLRFCLVVSTHSLLLTLVPYNPF